jgi:two-component system, NarL family, sensor histidine kinase UhpB
MKMRKRSRQRQIFRAWPFVPWSSAISIFLFVWLQNTYIGVFVPEYAECRISCLTWPNAFAPVVFATDGRIFSTPHDIVGNLLNALVTAATAAMVLIALNKWMRRQNRSQLSGAFYLATIVASALLAGLIRINVFPAWEDRGVDSWASISARYIVIMLIAHLLMGRNNQRYRIASEQSQRSAEQAGAALSRLREQQALVVTAEERARREVADFLHDRVQAGLLVAAMQVRNASEKVDSETAQQLQAAINDLENLRVDAVRGASRRLSPDLNAVGLDSALADLARSWSAAMSVTIGFESRAHEYLHKQSDEMLVTALYRTVEQALLNAAGHGQAGDVEVAFAREQDQLVLTVDNNGFGLPMDYIPGSGTALMDAWMTAVHGSWELTPGQRGALLTVRVPIGQDALSAGTINTGHLA